MAGNALRPGERGGRSTHHHEVRRAGPAPGTAARRRRRRLRHSHAHPGARHSGRARRAGPDRVRADRDREDGRLSAADPAAARRRPAGGPPARAGRHADARAGRADWRVRPAVRPAPPRAQHRGLRRGRHGAAEAPPARRPGSARRHPRTTARPSRPTARAARRRRSGRPRRGGPHARHGLPARHAAHPGRPPGDPAEPVLLRHHAGRDRGAHPPHDREPDRGRGRPPGDAGGRRPAGRAPGCPRQQEGPAGRAAAAPGREADPDLHPHPGPRQSTGPQPGEVRPGGRRRAWQQEPERPDPGARQLPRRPHRHPGRDRRRRARHRRARHQPRDQLRCPARPRGLRAPHRPHGPGRLERARRHPRDAGGTTATVRHRAARRGVDPARDGRRLRRAARARQAPASEDVAACGPVRRRSRAGWRGAGAQRAGA